MKDINLDAVACPCCGTSGASNLNASAQIDFTGCVDGEGWINCPDCGATVEFDEEGNVEMASGAEKFEWAIQLASAIEGVSLAKAMEA